MNALGAEELLRSQGWLDHKRVLPWSGSTTLLELEEGLKATYSNFYPIQGSPLHP